MDVTLADGDVHSIFFDIFADVKIVVAVSGLSKHCPICHFPPSALRPSVRHRRDISTFLDNLMI